MSPVRFPITVAITAKKIDTGSSEMMIAMASA
jgi:hypothetical protein